MSGKETNGTNGANGSKTDYSSTSSMGKPVYVPPPPEALKEAPKPPAQATRQGVTAVFDHFGQYIHAGRVPRPTQHGKDTLDNLRNKGSLKADLKNITMENVKTVLTLAKSKLKGEKVIDDKTMIMEKTIQLVAGLPDNSKLREELTNTFLNELWYTLDHPPMLYLGDKHKYRQPDGSWNNPKDPMQGAAGSTYARTCRPGIVQPGALPDPGLIFDTIMKRTNYRKHPNNVSTILWDWATIIIHDLFWTDHSNDTVTKTSAYLDLSPLYGSSQEMQDSIRTFKDGMMKPDTYADKRLHGMPPACSVILIMFNRFHNHVAAQLAAINEHGRFTPPSPSLPEEQAAAAWKKYDNDLFQTARLITNGLYINITLVDYVRNIVNLNRSNTTWTLDPRQEMGKNAGTNTGAERGTGSAVSAEFNLCYRWHSCISAKDEEWTAGLFKELFDKDPTEVTLRDMMMGFMKFDKSIPDEPEKRTFGGLERQADGRFSDDDLVNCISDAIEDCAGAFGGRNVPASMRPVEIMGILQGRKWEVAGLNEFRKHFGLKPFETFEDINSDPEIAGALRHLYEHPDFVELYPGMVAEEAKDPMVPGVGIAPTYTISRVILSDAVCLTRGDRFYTTDYNPRYLTSWGYNEASYDLNINSGCVFYKLFIRAFPNHFKEDSAYAHYPMCVPDETKKILTNLGRVQDFSFDRPTFIRSKVNVTSHAGAAHVAKNSANYTVARADAAAFIAEAAGGKALKKPADLFVASTKQTDELYKAGFQGAVKKAYAAIASSLLKSKSYKLGDAHYVDIVRDVGNLAPTHFAADMFSLPMKKSATDTDKKAIYTEDELQVALSVLYVVLFFELDPTKQFPFRLAAKDLAAQLGKVLEASVKKSSSGGGMFGGGKDGGLSLSSHFGTLVKALKKAGLDNHDIAWGQALPLAAAAVPNVSEMFGAAVDYYLTPEGSKCLPELGRLAGIASPTEADDALLLGYALEGVRLSGSFGAFRQAVSDDSVVGSDGTATAVKAGDRVFMPGSAAASKDGAAFPEPEAVNPSRPVDSYAHFALAPVNSAFGRELAQTALVEMFRATFKLKGLRRCPGPQGMLRKVGGDARKGEFDGYLREDAGSYFPFPCTMKVAFDA